jgi:hypothetical protein
MVSFGKAVSMYVTTDDNFCFLFIKKFITLSNLSNIYPELPVGALYRGKTSMLESLELRCTL